MKTDPASIRNSSTACRALVTILLIALFSCRSEPDTLFSTIPASHSGIHFSNTVIENDSINPLDLDFLYNGGGVAVGDFNNDGLADLYFTASTTTNRLYLNRSDFHFEDITEKAGLNTLGFWSNGAAVVDINNDGWQDIYVCTTIWEDANRRTNLLYINKGLNDEGIPVFEEMALEYNLADTSFSVHAAFFDFDNDGDLDLYLATTKITDRTASQFSSNNVGDTSSMYNDKLFRNDWSEELGHPVYTDISSSAGINKGGYALGLAICDINGDGWKDVYVTNDYFSSDLLYINNGDGTFTEKLRTYFAHTSQNAMGNDIADLDNDGLPDVVSVDMNPEDNLRKKKNMGGNNYFVHQSMLHGNYNLQYVRNTLQWNRGPRILEDGSKGDPLFSEIGYYSGIAATDWSWNVSLADFDNDGLRDIIITNGYPRDVTDHDFGSYRSRSGENVTKQELIDQIPQIKIPNYAYRNTGSMVFTDVSNKWGIDEPGFSNGAVYVDLDNDGDLDYVVNNINEKAGLFRNNTNSGDSIGGNYLRIGFRGAGKNRDGIGAITTLYYGNNKQVHENSPYRGYLSTVDNNVHFGLGKISSVDSIEVLWHSGKRSLLKAIDVNRFIEVDEEGATHAVPSVQSQAVRMFTDVTKDLGIDYQHSEYDHIDFDHERLLPHKLSQYGPALAAGDLDGDGLDDLIIGGNAAMYPVLMFQRPDGSFTRKELDYPSGPGIRRPENMGILIFDADGDGLNDIYLTSGSNEFLKNTPNYQDRLYLNTGSGNFRLVEDAIPKNYSSKSCVTAADIDQDGDLDLFIGGRVVPGSYPMPVSSILLRNDSEPGNPKFTDVTRNSAPGLIDIGLVCDALWTDFDNDGWTDLILAGEWMPLTFFKNDRGKLVRHDSTGIGHLSGWWNSIVAGDFDNDGNMDYVAGNLGLNSFYKASSEYPASIYAKDFDNNGSFDAITTLYLKDQNGELKEFTAHTRDDITNQLPQLKKRFLTYQEFGKADFAKMFNGQEMSGALSLKANHFASSYIRNLGNGKFEMHALPKEAQLAPLNGMLSIDINGDGNLDLVATGNDFGTETGAGRYDAMHGLVLLGNGNGQFEAQSISRSGFYTPGDSKALVSLLSASGSILLASSRNQGPLKVFRTGTTFNTPYRAKNNETAAILTLRNGRKRKHEFSFGSSFLSQSSRMLIPGIPVTSVVLIDLRGNQRQIHP